MGSSPVDSLVSAASAFLKRYPPFDAMEGEALRFMAERLSLAYYPRGSVILSPDEGEPQVFFIIQRGTVQVAAPADLPHAAPSTLGPGECFSVGALLERRAVSAAYLAAADTFCYQFPAADFHDLSRRSARFQAFCTDYLASLLRESRRLLKMNFSSSADEQQTMNRSLRSLLTRPPVSCGPDTPIASALRAMQQKKVGSIVVCTDDRPLGILTRHDVLDRIALAQRDLTQAVTAVMTPNPVTLPAEASAYEAALVMAQHGIRHIPVLDEERLVGVVTERDLFALQRVSMRQINRTINDADSLQDLQLAACDIRRLAQNLLAYGVGAEQITLLISTLNDTLTRRIIDMEKSRHVLGDIEWCWLAFGSEGRLEQTVSTDQDNGLIFNDITNTPPNETRKRLLPFTQAVNQTLDACGFPLCRGNIMAGNPQWCMSLTEWSRRFEAWIADTDPQALLNAAIFFDFRPLSGSTALATRLRDGLFVQTVKNPRFLRQMAQHALEVKPPLGMLRDFVTEDQADPPGTLDLKKSAARLFVDAARVFSLATATAQTSTAQRLRHGGTRLNLGADEIAAAVDAFYFIQLLRLRRQFAAENEPLGTDGNRINPYELNEIDRRIFKECLRQARKLQSRLALDYQL